MVSRDQPEIYIINRESSTQGDEILLSYYAKEYGIKIKGELSLKEALSRYIHLFQGYALFSFDEDMFIPTVLFTKKHLLISTFLDEIK